MVNGLGFGVSGNTDCLEAFAGQLQNPWEEFIAFRSLLPLLRRVPVQ